MLFKDLDQTFNNFIKKSGNEILIFCPYIQVNTLRKVLEGAHSKITIVTSWKTVDILSGISDIAVYPYCKSIGAYLYINQRIHLKVICDSYHSAMVGSANITDKGLGISQNHNHECAVVYEPLDSVQQIYLRSIIRESTLIGDKEFEDIKKLIESHKDDFRSQQLFEDVDFTKGVNKEFLISALPMSINIDTFFEYYSGKLVSEGFADVDYDCAMHDLALYQIPSELNKTEFLEYLKKAFFSQPFIQELNKFIDNEKYFGAIKEWVHITCLDVPVPSRRDITENVQVLYRWFAELGKDEFVIERPGHSEKIRRI